MPQLHYNSTSGKYMVLSFWITKNLHLVTKTIKPNTCSKKVIMCVDHDYGAVDQFIFLWDRRAKVQYQQQMHYICTVIYTYISMCKGVCVCVCVQEQVALLSLKSCLQEKCCCLVVPLLLLHWTGATFFFHLWCMCIHILYIAYMCIVLALCLIIDNMLLTVKANCHLEKKSCIKWKASMYICIYIHLLLIFRKHLYVLK